jgi:MFS transporter (putative signal transducer)
MAYSGDDRLMLAADAQLPLYRVLLAITGIYLVQSLIGGFTFQGIPAALRANGASLEIIGLFSLIMVPWALKFLWAPYIERYRLPRGAPRRSRHIIVVMQAIAGACFLLAAYVGPQTAWLLLAILLILALASATADIAVDGFAIQQLSAKDRGWGNTAQVGGGYLGIVLGGGLFLIVLGHYGWTAACLTMFICLVAFTIPFLLTPELRPTVEDGSHHTPSLQFAFRRTEIRYGILIGVLFEAGVRLVQSMSATFLIDRGLSVVDLGMLRGGGAIVSGILGTLLGGLAVRWLGPRKCVVISIIVQTTTLLALLAGSTVPGVSLSVLGAVVVAKSIAMAFGFVSLYSLFMGFSSQKQAGVDFTIFQCADALVAGIAGVAGGIIAQRLGYPVCFGLAAALGVAACLIIPVLARRGCEVAEAGTQ